MFHIACMKSWFENIRITRDLTCPLCNTVITDTSEAMNNEIENEHEPDEVSASIELETPDQKLQQNQNMLTNYVTLISCVDNYLSKDTARADSEDRFNLNPYEENELDIILSEEVKSPLQDDDSD